MKYVVSPVALLVAGLAMVLSVPAHAAGDATAGEAVFKQQCSICHSPVAGKNMTGPSLDGVVGRTTGSVPGFRYSAANKAANITWDEAELDKYLIAPKAVIPGTTMGFAGLKDDTKRANLIAYLSTLH